MSAQSEMFSGAEERLPAAVCADPLGLPAGVLCLALNQPYADLVVGGVKTLETRTWIWPYPPSWLAIYATKSADWPRDGRLGQPRLLPLGAIVGVVYVTGCRLMERGDEGAACYPFELARFVWPIERPHRFAVPERSHLKRGPQKFVRIPRAVVLAALGAS